MPGGKLAMQKVWSISKVPVLLQMAKASSLGGKTLAWVSFFPRDELFDHSCKSFDSLTISYRGGNVKELFYFTDHFMQKTEQLCGVMTEYFFRRERERENSETPKRIFLFASVTQRTQSRQTNDIPNLDGIILTEREAEKGEGGGVFGRETETETETETERERLFTRPNEITTPSVLFIFLSTIFFSMSYYVISYSTVQDYM